MKNVVQALTVLLIRKKMSGVHLFPNINKRLEFFFLTANVKSHLNYEVMAN